MNIINDLFTFVGSLIPFGTSFFAGAFSIGSVTISNLFALAVAAFVLLIVAIIIVGVSLKKSSVGGGKGHVRTSNQPKTEAQPNGEAQYNADVPEVDPDSDLLFIPPKPEQQEGGEQQAQPQEEQVAVYGGINEQQPQAEGEEGASEQEAGGQAASEQEETAKTEQDAVADNEVAAQETQANQEQAAAAQADAFEEIAIPQEQDAVEENPVQSEASQQEQVIPALEEQEAPQATANTENIEEIALNVPQPEPVQEDDLDDIDIEVSKAQEADDFVEIEPKIEEPKAAETAAIAKQTKENNITKPTKEEPMKAEKEVKTSKKAEPAALTGKFEISLAIDGYRFVLYANNGQLMYESVGFTSIEGAKKGIETFRKTLREMPYCITRDKRGRYRFVFNKKYQGETYSDKPAATRAAESVKRWAADAKVVTSFPTDAELAAYQNGLNSMRDKSDVDWVAVAKEEANCKKSGKIVIEADMNGDEIYGYRFYLIANNAQILYTSALYASVATATGAIDAFKRAVYVGNFYIDEDKTKHYRYILRGNNITYVGESYTNKAQAEKSVESVKNFVKTAIVMPYVPDAE